MIIVKRQWPLHATCNLHRATRNVRAHLNFCGLVRHHKGQKFSCLQMAYNQVELRVAIKANEILLKLNKFR